MENLPEVRTLLDIAKPIKPDAYYKPPPAIARHRDRFFNLVRRPPSDIHEDEWWWERHWEWLGKIRPDGQMIICCQSTYIPAQRFAWLLRNGPIPDGLFARPACGDQSCVAPHHLRLSKRRGSLARAMSRQLADDIRALFTDPNHPFTVRRLSEIFGVTERHIYRILGE